MASFMPPPLRADGTTISQASDGTLSANVSQFITAAPKVAQGNSASGAAGTAIASLAAAAGKRLIGIRGVIGTAGAAGSDVRLTLTMADDTTRTLDIVAGASQTFYADEANCFRVDGGATWPYATWSAAVDQGIKSIAATTLGAGTSQRYVHLAAVEVGA